MESEGHWASGYVTEIEYTFGYYRELSPGILRLACLSAGFVPPPQPLNYLELGFGQGLSINIHAAASDGEFWGTDFNPAQVAHARATAEAAGSGARLYEQSFAEFAERPDLPEFDIIGLHGIWTWISDQNGRIIVDLIRRKLKAGGIVYISYNCFPGWAPSVPLRHLMKLHADYAAESSGMLAKLDGAVNFAQQVIDSGAFFFRGNPAVVERLKRMSAMNRNYLAHEFFTHDWRVMPFSDVARWLEDAKLSFAASAHLLDHVEAVNLSEAGQKLLAGIGHPILRQSVRDYLVNQQFRRDIFSKGTRRLTGLEQAELLRQQAFILLVHQDDIPMKVAGSLGEATLSEEVYRPLISALADANYSAKTVNQLVIHPKLSSIPFSQIVQGLLVLTGAGFAHPAEEPSKRARTRCSTLNRYLCEKARSSSNVLFLASPVCATGVLVTQFQQLALLAAQEGRRTPDDQAKFVWGLLAAQGQRLTKDGKILESPEENLTEILKQVTEFTNKRLPVLKGLGITLA